MYSNEELRFKAIEMFFDWKKFLPETKDDWKLIKTLITFVQIGEMPHEIK